MLPRAPSLRSARSSFAAVVLLAFVGCDSGSSGPGGGGQTTTDTGDGKVHPDPNGVHISEKAACDALVDKQGDLLLKLKCVGTGQTCPSFLRAEFQTACMEYDQGSVSGCLAYYGEQTSCDSLKSAFDACVVTPYPGTEPAGCATGGSGGTGGTGATGGTGGTGGTGATGGSGGSGGVTSTGGTGGSGGVTSTASAGGSGGAM